MSGKDTFQPDILPRTESLRDTPEPLSICAGNVDKFQIVLRIAKPVQQLSHIIQAKYTSVFGHLIQIYSCFFVIHVTPIRENPIYSQRISIFSFVNYTPFVI